MSSAVGKIQDLGPSGVCHGEVRAVKKLRGNRRSRLAFSTVAQRCNLRKDQKRPRRELWPQQGTS
jgi:hypothetical protein